ncbi:metal-independent carbonic anhydrase [Pseudanabaena sp. Chao 1811]|uniref:metal-independent carbonic anhydrase n=1 Tax=Pseudanabaena sp. Chao 1811 TaxID=2963092 RepID=UPI0022F3F83E|nr:hypothetical protein [Pseudanabaena sp. Chao 1811]
MKFWKISISALLATVTFASGTLLVVKTSVAQSKSTTAPSSLKTTIVNRAITESEVLEAQKAWGEALVSISTTYEKEGKDAAKELAGKVIDKAYGYQFGLVLFKPTLTTAPQTFRTTRASALAYFVGDDPAFPRDKGFALNGWRKVEINNIGIFISGDTATSMGKVNLTDKDGNVVTVDKTWQFFKDDSGKLRIIVHHSSLPYSGK